MNNAMETDAHRLNMVRNMRESVRCRNVIEAGSGRERRYRRALPGELIQLAVAAIPFDELPQAVGE